MADDVLRRELRLAAKPETVFALLTEQDQITRWMGTDAKLDPRPGGEYWVNVAGKHPARGEFVEVSPPNRVVYTWGWEGNDGVPPGSTRVEIDLEADGDGTVLRVAHHGLDDDGRKQHGEGWDHYFARLVEVAAGTDPGPDPWAEQG